MSNSPESSCVRFMERMHAKLAEAERREKQLMAEQGPVKSKVKVKPRQSYGHGVIPREQWTEGGLRITNDAMTWVYDYVTRKAAGQPIGRREWAEKAGVSEYTLGEYAAMLRNGQIVLDPVTRRWQKLSR